MSPARPSLKRVYYLYMSPDNIPTTDIDVNHHIQRGILVLLRQEGPQSYAQLKPLGVEGNAYNYHLRLLKKSGLITIQDDVYHLTHTGHLVSDAFSFANHRLMLRPYHYTTPLITQGEDILVYISIRGPKRGRLSLPSGKLHYGDSVKQSIAREMERRYLSSDYSFSDIGSINIRYLLQGSVVLHRPGTLWHVAYRGERRSRTTETGRTEWMSIEAVMQSKDTLPELSGGIERLKNPSRDSLDLEYSLD